MNGIRNMMLTVAFAVMIPALYGQQPANGTPAAAVKAPATEKAETVDLTKLTGEAQAANERAEDKYRAYNRIRLLLYQQATKDPKIAAAQRVANEMADAYVEAEIENDAALKKEKSAAEAALKEADRLIVIAAGEDPKLKAFDRVTKRIVPILPEVK